jgi:hypothetical protein
VGQYAGVGHCAHTATGLNGCRRAGVAEDAANAFWHSIDHSGHGSAANDTKSLAADRFSIS